MNKRVIKNKYMCPFGCCKTNKTNRQIKHTTKRQEKREWKNEWGL